MRPRTIPTYSLERNKTRRTPPKPPGRLEDVPPETAAGVALHAVICAEGSGGQQWGAEAEGSKVRALPGRTDGFAGYDLGQVTPPPISTLP